MEPGPPALGAWSLNHWTTREVPRILCSYSYPHRSGHNVPVNFQQDDCYSLFCNFLSLYQWKSVIPLKGKPGKQRIEKGLLCVFQAIGNILLQRFRASTTKHRQQSTKVRAKGTDSTWSQVCSSLLQWQAMNCSMASRRIFIFDIN